MPPPHLPLDCPSRVPEPQPARSSCHSLPKVRYDEPMASGPPVTYVLLSLRRMAEADAQARLRAARSALEVARLVEQQASLQRQQCEQKLAQARLWAIQSVGTQVFGERLEQESRRVQQLRLALAQAQREESERTEQATEQRQQVEELQRHLRQCVARREAAELHEAAERREQRRLRDRRERAIEEDARDRILSTQRPGLRR